MAEDPSQAAMSAACQRAVAGGGVALAIVLPLWFNPFAAAPFEPPKVGLFLLIVAAMAVVRGVCALVRPAGAPAASPPRVQPGAGEQRDPLLYATLIYAAVHVAATLASADPGASFWGAGPNPHGTITILSLVALFLLMSEALRTPGAMEQVVTALLVGSVPVSLYGLAQTAGLDPLVWLVHPVTKAFSTMGNSIYLGAYLAMVAPFALSRLAEAHGWRDRVRYGLVLALQLACLFLTRSRGAWLGFLAACLLFLSYLAWQRRSRALLAAVVLALVAGGWLFTVYSGLSLAPQEPGRPAASLTRIRGASMGARQTIWGATLGLMPGHWLVGYGPEGFSRAFAAHYPPELARYEDPSRLVDDPHNIFLEHLVSAGIPGLLAFLGLVAAFVRCALARLRRTRAPGKPRLVPAAAVCSLLAFLIPAQFNPDVIVLSMLFWMDLALGSAAPDPLAR